MCKKNVNIKDMDIIGVMDRRVRIIRLMTPIALERLHRFFTDFTAKDIPEILETEEDVLYWFVKDYGTRITTQGTFVPGYDVGYEINIAEGTLTKIWEREAM